MAAGRLRDDHRVDESAAGEISPAVRPAPVYGSFPGAVRARHLRPPVREQPVVGHRRARRAWHGGRRAGGAGAVLHLAGLPRQTPPEGRGAGPGLCPAGAAAGAHFYLRTAADRRVAWLVPVRTGAGPAGAGLRAGPEAAARRPPANLRTARLPHLYPVRARHGPAVRRAGAGTHGVVDGIRMGGREPGRRHRADHGGPGHRT
ncbi:hypothetical protein D3C81_1482070 [compost metagenome]